MSRKKKPVDDGKPKKPKKPKKPPSDNTLIKGALRRAFARSAAHRTIIESMIVPDHVDTSRPKVKTWARCPSCNELDAKSYMQVDHVDPVQPLGVHIDEMSKHDILDRIFCSIENLKGTCKKCHTAKSTVENAERRRLRNAKKLLR